MKKDKILKLFLIGVIFSNLSQQAFSSYDLTFLLGGKSFGTTFRYKSVGITGLFDVDGKDEKYSRILDYPVPHNSYVIIDRNGKLDRDLGLLGTVHIPLNEKVEIYGGGGFRFETRYTVAQSLATNWIYKQGVTRNESIGDYLVGIKYKAKNWLYSINYSKRNGIMFGIGI